MRARHLQIQPDPRTTIRTRGRTRPSRTSRASVGPTSFCASSPPKWPRAGSENPLTDQSISPRYCPTSRSTAGSPKTRWQPRRDLRAHEHRQRAPVHLSRLGRRDRLNVLYQGYYYGDVVFPVQPNGFEAAIDTIFGIKTGTNTFTGRGAPRSLQRQGDGRERHRRRPTNRPPSPRRCAQRATTSSPRATSRPTAR